LRVKVTDGLGCTTEVHAEVAFPEPNLGDANRLNFEVKKLAITSEPEVGVDEELIFESEFSPEFISWNWDFGDGQSSSQKMPIHKYEQPGIFEVKLSAKDSFGCTSIQKTQVVVVLPKELLVIPNAFSPNGVKLYDLFLPIMNALKEVRIQIFNIWGEILYTGTGVEDSGWDGTHNGQIVPAGNYIYRLD
jgi:gliding motility-associated-like protein